MRARPGNDARSGRRFATRGTTLLAAAAAIALLVGPAQAAPPGCDTGYFTIDTISGPVTAGTAFDVTVRAFDCEDEEMTDYEGTPELSGAGDAPDGTEPVYGDVEIDENGVATASVTLYDAAPGVQLTVSDDVLLDGMSNAFDVDPAGLDSFEFDPIANQTAGTEFEVTVTAYDEYENVQSDYDGPATLDGASGSAPGDSPNLDDPVYGALDWTAGVGTADVTLFKAEGDVALAVSDDGAEASADSDEFDVFPGPLDSFDIEDLSTATAGTSFEVTVTAYDEFGNVKTDYAGEATVDGEPCPALPDPCLAPGTSPNGDAPDYGALAWFSGVGIADVTLYRAETGRKLSVDDSAAEVSATSNAFDVLPGPLASFELEQVGQEFGPPIHYVVEVATSTGVTATAYDPYGNVKTNYAGGATLSGDLEGAATYVDPTWVDGVGDGSFTAAVHSIDRTLTLTDGTVTEPSNAFDVVAEVCGETATCEGSTPTGSKKVKLDTDTNESASIGFYNPPGGQIECLLKNGGTQTMVVAGAISLVNPPPGYTFANPLTVTMTLTKDAQPSKSSTGVANFLVCLSKNRGVSFHQIIDCRSGNQFNPADEIPCISSRKRIAGGGLEIKALITSTDPWGGIG